MSTILTKLKRGWGHVRRGTVLRRLQFAVHSFQGRRRLAAWQARTRHLAWLEESLAPGVRMMLYRDSVLSQLIFVGGFEVAERRFLQRFLRPGDIFVDVGANIGLFTLLAAYHVGSTGYVHAFEPTRKTFGRLQENVTLNKFSHVTCHNVALSDREGAAVMQVWPDQYDAWNTIGVPTLDEPTESETIRTTTWDQFAAARDLGGRVTMMKLDVEGWEQHVLRGGAESLARPDAPVLQVEFTEPASRATGSSCTALYRLLEELGYRMYLPQPTGDFLLPYPPREEFPAMNLLAIKALEPVLVRLEHKSDKQV